MRTIALAGRPTPRGNFAEIFDRSDTSIQRIADLASAVHKIRAAHPGGVDVILIGRANEQGMKIVRDTWGVVSVLIGFPPATLSILSDGDEVVVAFNHGALRSGGVLGFLWEGDSAPPESNSTAGKSRLDINHHLHRLKLA